MTRSAFISIVGRPNVGKSTLLNALVGEHVAIVSPKPQTTRGRVTGVLTRDSEQLVFVDTPGLHRPRTRLGEYMAGEIAQGMQDVDAAVLVTEPRGALCAAERELYARLAPRGVPVVLVINKVDTLRDKSLLLEKIAAFAGLGEFAQVVPLSAKTGDGIGLLLNILSSYAKEGPHYYDEDAYTGQTERELAAELVREQLLHCLRDEIPHGAAVVVEKMRERERGGIVDVDAVIYCEKASHKGIIIGKDGAALKQAATRARQAIEELTGTRVNLQCHVKVQKDWRNRESVMARLGFKK